MLSADDGKSSANLLGRPNVRALAAVLALSVTWTLMQLVGAQLANSESLRSDALAMCVDGAAYALNLVAEVRPEHERSIKLAAPFISAVLLLVVTATSLMDAIETLLGAGDDESVDGGLVLAFGAAMLLVDVAMVITIFFRGNAPGAVAWCHVSLRTELNLSSALSHVIADALRSLTQVVVGTVILSGGPSETVDAFGSLVISSTILVGAILLLQEVAMQWRHTRRRQRATHDTRDTLGYGLLGELDGRETCRVSCEECRT